MRTVLADVLLQSLVVLDDAPRRDAEANCALLGSEARHSLARKPAGSKRRKWTVGRAACESVAGGAWRRDARLRLWRGETAVSMR
jgi:hypothetical protein